MKMLFLHCLPVLLLANFSRYSHGADRRPAFPKHTVDAIARQSSKRDLARKTLELQTRLLASAGKTDDLESGTGGLSPLAVPTMRRRTQSDDPLAGSVEGLHGTVADFLSLQNTQLQRQHAADLARDRFHREEHAYNKRTRRIAIASTVASISFTTATFIWTHWDSISKMWGGGSHD